MLTVVRVFIVTIALSMLASAQSAEKVVFSFDGSDGNLADSGLVADARGNLYGTTFNGGPDGYGNVYELQLLSAGTWKETVLFNFHGNDGAFPVSALTIDSAGNLYGTAQAGGLGHCISDPNGGSLGCGVVFKLTPTGAGWQESTVYSFQPGVNKGVVPVGSVIIDAAGNLYGTTWAPGVEGDFVMEKAGADPQSGTYWGCDQPGCGGTVYKLTPTQSGWQETELYAFTGAADGSSSQANLYMDSAGNLYGTTPYGGSGHCQYACGVVFKLSPNGGNWTETVLHSFTGSDGSYPTGNLAVDAAGNFYSTTSSGGAHNHGAIFELTPAGQASVLYSFTGGVDGAEPFAGPILDSRGNLFGTAAQGGVDSVGTAYELDHNAGQWSLVVLHGFKLQNDGEVPYGPLVFLKGLLVGTTQSGGVHGLPGAVYQLLP